MLARLLKVWAKIFISVNQHNKMKLITANMNHFVRIQVGVGLKRWTNNAHALLLICSFCHQSSGQKLSSIWKANNISYSAKIIWRVFALLLLSYLLCPLLTVSEMLGRVSSTSSHRYDRNSHFIWVYLYETELLNSCWCRAEAIRAVFPCPKLPYLDTSIYNGGPCQLQALLKKSVSTICSESVRKDKNSGS